MLVAIRHHVCFHGKIGRLVIVPMLTSCYPRFRGNPGCRNKNLIECFRRFRIKEDVDNYYMTLREYFKESIRIKKVKVRIEKDEMFFPHRYGQHIFHHIFIIPADLSAYIDPDTGIKEQNYNEKHLSFDELKTLWDRLDTGSVLMVGQHFQKNRMFGQSDPEAKAADVIRLTSSSPLIIADNTVMVIFLTKNAQLRSELREILKNYEKKVQSIVKDPKKRHAITAFG